MTTPMVDTVRNIPLIIERDVPMEAEDTDTGFPFDRDDRDDHFRGTLEDIAQRHPEFAEHLEGFRSDSLGRRRPPRPSDSDFRRFTDRPLGSSRFERFFRDPFEDEFEPKQPERPAQSQEQQQPEEKPKPERSRRQNIQQSNTVDLGQKQEPVNDRNQRSMSAPPPDNRPRYVSSINIPINRDGEMGKPQSQPPQQPQQQPPQPQQPEKPVERVIPIHVEGRDEPVLPKHSGPGFAQPQPERGFGGQPQERVFRPQPEPERIFGHRPSQFTQFVPPRQQQQQQFYEPEVRQQKFQQQQAPQQQKFQQQKPQETQQQKPQETPQQQQQQPKPTTPIDIIQSIQKDVSELMSQVEKFNGAPKDKQYLYLDEMLTRNLIKLDNIDTQGQENIRQARKEAIKCIEKCISILEAKAAANVSQDARVESEESKAAKAVEMKEEAPQESNQEPVEEKMEVVNKEKSEERTNQEKMEVVSEPVEEKMEVTPPPPTTVEEKTEVVQPATEVVQQPPVEEKPKEENVSENKPTTDEEMKEVVPTEEDKNESETVKEEEKKNEESSDDKKEKKEKKKATKK